MAEIGHEASSSSSGSAKRGRSVVFDHGRRKSSCGYCKSSRYSSVAHGIWAHSITTDDYQELLDRGWRRSGSFLYKPEMESTCCPSYTIRLKAGDFVCSKEQLRVSRRMQRFLGGTLAEKNSSKALGCSLTRDSSSITLPESSIKESNSDNTDESVIHYLSTKLDHAINECVISGQFPSAIQLPKAVVKKVTSLVKKKLTDLSGNLLYTSSISFQIYAVLRRHQSAGKDDHLSRLSELSPNIIAEKLAHSVNQQGELSAVSIQACNGHLNFFSSTIQNSSGEVPATLNPSIQSRQGNESSAKEDCLSRDCLNSPIKRRRLEIHLKLSSFDPEEYALYRRYQIKVHNDTPDRVTESSYRRFLVDTPIIFVPPTGDKTVPLCGFGSFHQQYVIDGKLVAVGVVDILPRCLSSKYLFWDPDLPFLSLGKYTALQEIDWVKKAEVHCPSLQYYYLGYYIHSCSKMRYKASYCPSELLCPLRYQWVPFDIAKPLLDKKPYVVLSDFSRPENRTTPPLLLLEDSTKQPCLDYSQDDLSESLSDEDVEMEPYSEGSDMEPDEDLGTATNDLLPVDELNAGDVSNVMIELNGVRVKFKDLQRVIGPKEKRHMEALEQQLRRYARVVGQELADRMTYCFG